MQNANTQRIHNPTHLHAHVAAHMSLPRHHYHHYRGMTKFLLWGGLIAINNRRYDMAQPQAPPTEPRSDLFLILFFCFVSVFAVLIYIILIYFLFCVLCPLIVLRSVNNPEYQRRSSCTFNTVTVTLNKDRSNQGPVLKRLFIFIFFIMHISCVLAVTKSA